MKNLIDTIRTIMRLGLGNIFRVALYRLALKSRLSSIRKVTQNPSMAEGPFFETRAPTPSTPISMPPIFGYHKVENTNSPPDWLSNPLNGQVFKHAALQFWAITDFDANAGDIKQYWEMSRFGWVLDIALTAHEGDRRELSRLNDWLQDWLDKNPPYQGPNWKCGQEASIRVLHLIVATVLAGQDDKACQGLQDLIALHLERISPTVSYAKAQDNNHGTSEAAALFVGGTFLDQYAHSSSRKWAKQGRKLLENRIRYLIAKDGSFSQHSVNYHRMMLDSLSICEWWRKHKNLETFTDKLQSRAKAASNWLYQLTDDVSGDVPNIGANDGAHLLNLFQGNYRDYRPSVSLAYALWHNQSAYEGVEVCEQHLAAMKVSVPQQLAELPRDAAGIEGGYAVKSVGFQRAILRHPRFRFRPSQSDALHLDIWYKGKNIFRDGGTYSYNSGNVDLAYFGGTASHNTVEFDGRDQMPRLGRFLFGSWLKTRNWEWSKNTMQAGYKDSFGASHDRRVEMRQDGLDVIDQIAGYKDEAILRWRFAPDLWTDLPDLVILDNSIEMSSGGIQMIIQADAAISAIWEIGCESRFYLLKTELPVLRISMRGINKIKTEIRWMS